MLSMSKKSIVNCFDGKTKQEDVLVALYRIAFPQWDRISKIDNWPKVSKATDRFITQKFIDFDRQFHPEVMNGGLWLNNGFSTLDNDSVPDWKIDSSCCIIHY